MSDNQSDISFLASNLGLLSYVSLILVDLQAYLPKLGNSLEKATKWS